MPMPMHYHLQQKTLKPFSVHYFLTPRAGTHEFVWSMWQSLGCWTSVARSNWFCSQILRYQRLPFKDSLLERPCADCGKMHFALPPRKSSHPPPYARASRSSPIRRKQILYGTWIGCAVLATITIYLATRLLSASPDRIPGGSSDAVIVTMIDPENMSNEYIRRIKENRQDYADRHGLT